jgi:hypothetical protein
MYHESLELAHSTRKEDRQRRDTLRQKLQKCPFCTFECPLGGEDLPSTIRLRVHFAQGARRELWTTFQQLQDKVRHLEEEEGLSKHGSLLRLRPVPCGVLDGERLRKAGREVQREIIEHPGKPLEIQKILGGTNFLQSSHLECFNKDDTQNVKDILAKKTSKEFILVFDFQKGFSQWIQELLPKKEVQKNSKHVGSPPPVSPVNLYQHLYQKESHIIRKLRYLRSLLKTLDVATRGPSTKENGANEDEEAKGEANANAVEEVEDVEDVEDADDVEDAEDVEEVEEVEDVEDAEDVEDIEEVEDVEACDNADADDQAASLGSEDVASEMENIEELEVMFWGSPEKKTEGLEEFWNFCVFDKKDISSGV